MPEDDGWYPGMLAAQDQYNPAGGGWEPPAQVPMGALAAQDAAAARLRGPYAKVYEAAQERPTNINTLAKGVVNAGIQSVQTPGSLMEPNPYPPGSEEWQWYADNNSKVATEWAPQQAVNRIAAGTPFAQSNALGSGGGKLVQPEGIRAYHGSPHDFDRFDITKIGTGQGAQSYGHGLYFAENPAVAADYRRMLAGEPELKSLRLGDMRIGEHNQWDYTKRAHVNTLENIKSSLAEDALIDQAGLIGAPDKTKYVLEILDRKIDDYKTSWPEGLKDAMALRQQIERQGVDLRMGKQPGKSYEVNLRAKPEDFMDWDSPIGKQPERVQKLIRDEIPKSFDRIAEKGTIRSVLDDIAPEGYFAKQGVPGIKYLDAHSRDAKMALDRSSNPQDLIAPKLTSNYVVFDPSIVDILKKYGLAGATAAPLGMGALAAQDKYEAK